MYHLPLTRTRTLFRQRTTFKPYVKRTFVKASLLENIEIIGRGLMLFVFFASTLNWLHYKELRETRDRKDKDI